MTSRRTARGMTLATALLLASPGSALSGPVVIDFDDLPADGIIGNPLGIYPGNQYASSGVLFRTGDLVGTVVVGGTVTLTNPVDQFELLGGPGQPAVSPPNFAIPLARNLNDLLMIFTTPVTSVSVTSDNFPEGPDVIRLIALSPGALPNQFTVLAFDEKLDNAVSPPANLLSVSLGGAPFSFALFQVVTEGEGFDNLTFNQVSPAVVPEPGSLTLLGTGAVGVFGYARRRRSAPRR